MRKIVSSNSLSLFIYASLLALLASYPNHCCASEVQQTSDENNNDEASSSSSRFSTQTTATPSHEQQTPPPQKRPWVWDEYPHPEHQAALCHTTESHRFCDPDQILSDRDRLAVDQYLQQQKERRHQQQGEAAPDAPDSCQSPKEEEGAAEEFVFDPTRPLEIQGHEIQMAVALVEKMDLTFFRNYEAKETRAAEDFARNLHDRWGVGVEITDGTNGIEGGTGILLFLSDQDRTIYISRGDAVASVLTNARIDRVIEHMKPFLYKQEYREAILNALRELELLIQVGEPSRWERFQDFFIAYSGIGWVAAIFGFTLWSARKQSLEQQRYAAVASQLSEMDRARAEALQGRYQTKSCPICLEPFPIPPKEEGQEEEPRPTHGSDGQPLKLLRCGHVFDESCWAEWVSSGQGQIQKCPICQQDVGGENSNAPQSGTTTSLLPRLSTDGPAEGENNNNNNENNTNNETATSPVQQDQPELEREPEQRWMIRQYNQERNFRLARMAVRYPQYIGSQQIQRWTQSTYDGSLARDPTFVRRDPSLQHRSTGGSSTSSGRSSFRSGGGGGFGGGSSGGGRGGRW